MLKGEPEPVDLVAKRDELFATCAVDMTTILNQHTEDAITPLTTQQTVSITYPVNEYPAKVTSFNFDKAPRVSGLLVGIKGQYLILDSGVLNIRKFSGYKIHFQAS